MSTTQKRLHQDFAKALTMVKAGVHPYLVGPAGCGKTTLAKQIAEDLKLPFRYTGAVESAFQLRGFKDAHGNTVHTPFRDAYEQGGVFLFDELDASNANAIVSVHAALDNGELDAPDGMIKRHKDFHYLAAANSWGAGATLDYMGRNALDGATLDRYAFIAMDYDEVMEQKVIADAHPRQTAWPLIVQQTRAAVRNLKIRHVVSPRASLNGAALLDAGLDLQSVFKNTVLKGMNKDDIEKVTRKIDFALTVPRDNLKTEQDMVTAIADVERQLAEARLIAITSRLVSEQAQTAVLTAETALAETKSKVKVLDNFLVSKVAGAVSTVQGLIRHPVRTPQ